MVIIPIRPATVAPTSIFLYFCENVKTVQIALFESIVPFKLLRVLFATIRRHQNSSDFWPL